MSVSLSVKFDRTKKTIDRIQSLDRKIDVRKQKIDRKICCNSTIEDGSLHQLEANKSKQLPIFTFMLITYDR